MTILILHGPNLDLVGLKSAKAGEKLTLDKINRAIRLHVRKKDINLKIIQTHKECKNFWKNTGRISLELC